MTNIYFETLGCSINVSETEVMKGLLSKYDFKIVNNPDSASVIVINICTVKGNFTATRKIRKLYEEFTNKKFVIAGCLTKNIIPDIRAIVPDCSLISTHNINEIVCVIEETINDNPITIISKNNAKKIEMPKIRKNPVVGIIAICEGCLGYCTYCSVKMIKGNLISYPVESILNEINTALNSGCKEIWLTSQDTGAYGKDINTNLAELLKEIIKIDKNFLIRVGMCNPDHVKEMTDELIEVYKSPKIFKFLHVPVQSGNDEILNLMKRHYKVSEFIDIVSKFRKEIPNITISTDVIVGFPTESRVQFQDSIDLIKEIMPDVLNISRFNPRPGTHAAKMEQLKGDEIKERSRKMTNEFDWLSFKKNKKWEGWKGQIIIDEKGKDGTYVGRNLSYKPIVVKGEFKLGDKVTVKITNSTKHYLIGERLNLS